MNSSEKISLDNARFDQEVNPENSEIIEKVLRKTRPIECDILGNKTVAQISRGKKFDSVEGGRHLNFVETISVLSGIASMAQVAIMIFENIRRSRNSAADIAENPEELKRQAENKFKELLSTQIELKDLSAIVEGDKAIIEDMISEVYDNIKN